MRRSLNSSSLVAVFCATSVATIVSFGQLAFAADSPAQAEYILGNKAAEASQYAEAIDHYTRAIKIDPSCWKAYANRGCARYNSHDYKNGLADINTAIPHIEGNNNLANLKLMCEKAIADANNGNADVERRRQMARQMLLNAQLGGDMSDPGFQILMAARRKAGLNPITGMPNPGSNAAAAVNTAPQSNPFASPESTNSNAVTSRLEAMSKGVHTAVPAATSSTAAKTKTPAASTSVASADDSVSNGIQDRLANQVAGLPAPDFSNTQATATTPETPQSPFNAPSSSAPVAESSSFTPPPSSVSLVTPLSSLPSNKQQVSTPPGNRRLSAVNYARDPKTGMTSQDYYARACGKDNALDYQGALKDYDEAIRLNPNHGPAYANRGSCRFNSGDRKGALEDYNMAVELLPDNQDVRNLRDRIAQSVGR